MLKWHVIILLLGIDFPLMCLGRLNVSESILYPYGEEHGDLFNPRLDDGSSPEVLTTVNFTFSNQTFHNLFVNNNGHLSFQSPVSSYKPSSFPLMTNISLVAPFWADVQNRLQGNISYRQSQDTELLRRVTSDIVHSFPHLVFSAIWALVATWDSVGYYGSTSDKVNTFQVVLTTDGTMSFILFNYGNIEWISGTSTGGDKLTGLGGLSAQAGLFSGNSKHYFNIPGSRAPDILNITSTSNVNIPGRWIFRVDELSLPNGCIYNERFMDHGTAFWNSKTCNMQCQCTNHSEILCRLQPCAKRESCQSSNGYYLCRPTNQKTCTVSGGSHYNTFDGRFFDLSGFCSYVLSKLCRDTDHLTGFQVIAKMGESTVTPRPWPEMVTIMAYDYEITLMKGRAGYMLVNGVKSPLQGNFLDGRIRVSQRGFTMVVSTDFGLVVTFDGLYQLTITVGLNYFNYTCGLCGTPNRDPSDDLQTPDGSQAASNQIFAESWRVASDSGVQCTQELVVPTCTDQSSQLYASSAYCGIIGDTNGPFAECVQALHSENFVTNCVKDLCASNETQEVLCLILASYVERCQASNVTVKSWRKEGFCGVSCPENSHYVPCGTACPASCTDPQAPQFCNQPCRESCLCKPNFTLSAGICVPMDQCGCSMNGHYHKLGEQVLLGGYCSRKCTCREPLQEMSCEEHTCSTYEKCSVVDAVRSCHPAPSGSCKVWGDLHYHTYDGLTYNYHGVCRYTLTKTCGDLGPLAEFHVGVQNIHKTSNTVPWTQMVEVHTYGHLITLSAAHEGHAQINGTTFSLPISLHSGLLQIQRNGSSAVVQAAFGLSVSYDWHHKVNVNVSGAYSGIVCGLCGDFNGNHADDFRDPTGLKVNDVAHFAKSWQDPDYAHVCAITDRVPACGMEKVSLFFSKRYCGILTDTDGPFTQCNVTLNGPTKLTDCVYHMCVTSNTQKAFCEEIQSFAQQCQRQGITIQQWRNLTQCEMKCQKENTHYELCGTSCPVLCSNHTTLSSCSAPCEEGCQCDRGFVLNDTDCIPLGECGCTYDNRHYRPRDTWRGEDCLTICMCNDTTSIVQCTNSMCGPEEDCGNFKGVYECHVPPEGHCRVSGGTGYSTFDGSRFNVQTNCKYILSELCMPSDSLTFFSVEVTGDHWAQSVTTATNEVSVYTRGHLINFKRENKESVKVDGVSVNLPVSIDGGSLVIYKSGINMVLKTSFGLSLIYDHFTVLVVLHSRYRGKTCGLCGNFNGDPSDDLATQNQTWSNKPSHFTKDCEYEESINDCGGTCSVCENFNPGSMCDILKDPSGPFSICHLHVDPRPSFSECLKHHCLAGGENKTLCLSIQIYAAACQAVNATIPRWRNESFCALTCPENSHYDHCGVPCQASCATSVLGALCGSTCSEGCFCDGGYLQSGDACVLPENCGCVHQGRYYKVHDLFWLSNCTQRCYCESPGVLHCFAATCNPGQQCMVQNGSLGCFDVWATCIVTGDSHYFTFDGALVHFQGNCAYEVTHTCWNSADFFFQVITENRNHQRPNVTFVPRVNVRLRSHDSEVNVALVGSNNVQVNRVRTSLPQSLGLLGHISKLGNMLMISTSFGIEIHYRLGTLIIRVSRKHQGRLCGMCGNFNLDPEDDKMLPGGQSVANDNKFETSWTSEVSLARCHAGDVHPNCQDPHGLRGRCQILTNRLGPFAECHWHEDPMRFRTSCDYDLCHYGQADGMKCTAVAAYEEACRLHGVLVAEWRAKFQCPEEEDPCDSLMCTEREWCGQREGDFGCFCDEEYKDLLKENYDFNLTCSGRQIQVSLSRCLLVTDRVLLDTLHLEDPRCIGTPQGDRLLFSFDSVQRACGTQVQVNITHTIFINKIQGLVNEGATGGTRTINIPFSCVHPLTINLVPLQATVPVQAITGANLPAGQGLYKTSMLLYQDPQYSQHFTESPIWLSSNDRIYVGLSASNFNPTMFVLTIAKCWATADRNPLSRNRWDLITNQCPNPRDRELVIEEDGVSTIGRFSFRVFQYISDHSQVYLHCRVQLCSIQKAACTRSCGRAHVAITKREELSPVLSVGPIQREQEQAAPAALHGDGAFEGCGFMLFLPLLYCVILILK